MVENQKKIQLVVDKLNNIQGDIDSYVAHANVFQDKYSLEEVLINCNSIKSALIKELEFLGGTWPVPLD